jgi:hypothetical protein
MSDKFKELFGWLLIGAGAFGLMYLLLYAVGSLL